MRILMIGQKGVPATVGGIERHVEELGAGLVERGHEVIVFARSTYTTERVRRHRGMQVRTLRTVRTKHLDAIVQSTLASIASLAAAADIVHYHAVGPGLPSFLPRIASRAAVVQTIHGLDAERAKWGLGARSVLRLATWLSARVPDATIVVSRDLARHYARRYRRATRYIPNGVREPVHRPPAEIIDRLGLMGGDYLLFVGRLVPEKAPDLLLRAFRKVRSDARVVLVGGSSFTDAYVASLRDLASQDPRVVLAGEVVGPMLEELYSNAAAFVLPSSLEGLPLTLLEAASFGIPVVASDIPPHLEILGRDGPGRRTFPTGDERALAATLERVLVAVDEERRAAKTFAAAVMETYRWEDVVRATESVYLDLVPRP
jgi:glycosyltransferase involved in cell wall biosynthesis